jgi:hypothetical protein
VLILREKQRAISEVHASCVASSHAYAYIRAFESSKKTEGLSYWRDFPLRIILRIFDKSISCNPESFTMSNGEVKKKFQWHEIASGRG